MTRSPEIDTIRAVALLGICLVNVPLMAQPVSALLVTPTGVDLVAKMALQTFVEGKFFVLFSFIFGWGFAIQMAAAERAGQSANARFLRRLAGLALIGITHATLVFFGDILVLYALLGLPLLVLRHTSPRRLMVIAMIAVAVGFVALLVLAINLPQIVASAATASSHGGYTGGFMDAMRQRLADWPAGFGFILLFNAPLAFASFCVGLAAAKVGFFEPGNTIYTALKQKVPVLLLVGAPLNIIYALASSNFLGAELTAAVGFAGLAFGGPILGAVYLVAVIELTRAGHLQGTTAAAGKMSLTAYVLEGVLAGLIFNGYGLGLYGSVGALGCILIAVLIFIATHISSVLWLRVWSQGPLEMLLRRITRAGG
jgi:uncharacterized protein